MNMIYTQADTTIEMMNVRVCKLYLKLTKALTVLSGS